MENQNLVSIIIPIYNSEKFLNKCVESVVGQTYKNIEIILVNDGSMDRSAEICNEWKEKDCRIIVLHNPNGGPSVARNAGIRVARGKYIYFLDSDDYIKHTLIEEVVFYMNKGYDMVSFGYHIINSNGIVENDEIKNTADYALGNYKEKREFVIQNLMMYKVGWEPWSRMFRRDIIEKYNVQYPEGHNLAEDLYFCLCYCAHCNRIFNIDKALYYYRKHNSSIMTQAIKKLHICQMDNLGKLLYQYYAKDDECRELVNVFPVIYYLLINHDIKRYQTTECLPIRKLKKVIDNELKEKDFFCYYMKSLKKNRKSLHLIYSITQSEIAISNAKYYADGKYCFLIIRYQLIKVYARLIKIKKMIGMLEA